MNIGNTLGYFGSTLRYVGSTLVYPLEYFGLCEICW